MSRMKMVAIWATRQLCLTTAVLLVAGVCLGKSAAQAQTFAYVANGGSSSVSVIDTSSNTVIATLAVGNLPVGVSITPDGTWAYVANAGDTTVSVIGTASNTVVATVG